MNNNYKVFIHLNKSITLAFTSTLLKSNVYLLIFNGSKITLTLNSIFTKLDTATNIVQYCFLSVNALSHVN